MCSTTVMSLSSGSLRSTGIVAFGKAALSIMSAQRTSSALGAGSRPKRAAPMSAMSFVAEVYVPSWNMRRWPAASCRSTARSYASRSPGAPKALTW